VIGPERAGCQRLSPGVSPRYVDARMARHRWKPLGEPLGAWVALAGGILAVCAHSASSYPVPVMMKSILAEMGWGRGEFSATSITRSAAVALTGFAWGLATDRFGARAVLVAGALLAATGLVGFGAMHSLGELYLIGAVIGSGIGALGPVATSTLVARRFGPRRGLAIGLLHGCDNLINSAIPRATAALLVAWGWRRASWMIAGVYVLVAFVILLLIRPGDGRSAPLPAGVTRSLRLRDLPWRSPELHLVSLVFVAAYAFLGAVMFHFVPHQTDIGIGVEYASASFGYLILAGFFGSLAVGLGTQRTSALVMLAVVQGVVAVASLALWTVTDAAGLRWWAWVHGVAAAGYAPLTALVMAELFGADARNLGGTIGLAFLIAMSGIYLGNAGLGWAHDVAGSYVPAWRALSGLLAASLVPLGVLLVRARGTVRAAEAA
jgi:Major Facilitator Superfamily